SRRARRWSRASSGHPLVCRFGNPPPYDSAFMPGTNGFSYPNNCGCFRAGKGGGPYSRIWPRTVSSAEPSPPLSSIYDDVIMDHIKNARNYRELPEATRRAEGINPLCGDTFTVYLALEGERIRDAAF